ncbi:DUF3800 domain-containing protein [Elioraea sp.]|uniref:DUF3800 domain-containing protein n=1 Tax=Elioraea sp. TaxID=2185103 RepID=UPI003F6F999F
MPATPRYIVFVDESGDHGLTSIDPSYPIFVLNFCIFEVETYITAVVPAIQRLKFAWFGHDLAILHEHDIVKQKPPFAFLQNAARRARFMDDLTALMEQAPFTLISAVIDKRRLASRYAAPENPYEIAMRFCLERLWTLLREQNAADSPTQIVFEKRGKHEDAELELAFRRICDLGDYHGRPMATLRFLAADKRTNSPGLQLADLTARPVGLHVLRPVQQNRAYDVIATKFRRAPNGRVEGFGLKIFPS